MPTVPRPASTVVLTREGRDGVEVFLVRRKASVAFMAGAHVFPGGAVDQVDRSADPAPRVWCDGIDVALARMPDVTPEAAIAFHMAAVRELFEEAGVLLARNGRGKMLAIPPGDVASFSEVRRAAIEEHLPLLVVAETEGVRLALDALVPFARWITPELESRRFDAYFFLAAMPQGQQASHDAHEASESCWISPRLALDRCRAGEIALPPPTWTTLRWLAELATVSEALDWASTRRVPIVQPSMRILESGARLVLLPGDPLWPPVEGFEVEETRFLLEHGRWTPVRHDDPQADPEGFR